MPIRASALALLAATPVLTPAGVHPIRGEMIALIQQSDAPVSADFRERHLPGLESLATELGSPLRVVDVTDAGAPAEVALTPLIVFQNHKGRSIFQGRYADMGKVRHFVRTSRFVPQGEGGLVKDAIPVAAMGRARVGAPIKITPLADMADPAFDFGAFEQQAHAAVRSAFETMTVHPEARFGRSDRLFYMDFYPYAAEGGNLAILMAFYSQFDCENPVYTEYGDVVFGPMGEGGRLFAEAARMLEREMDRQIATSTIGDGFVPVPSDTAIVSWESLGLALPPAPVVDTASLPDGFTLGQDWRVLPESVEGAPLLAFRFPPPLDNYVGSAGRIEGGLRLGPNASLDGATGHVVVPVESLTMGEPGLDATVYKSISADAYSTARFDLESVSAKTRGPLEFGTARPFTGRGTFAMKGIEIPLELHAELTPTVTEAGTVRLLATATFSIRLREAFGIEGPPGPAPLNDTVEFFLVFPLEAASPGKIGG